jgi:hypothetical protein
MVQVEPLLYTVFTVSLLFYLIPDHTLEMQPARNQTEALDEPSKLGTSQYRVNYKGAVMGNLIQLMDLQNGANYRGAPIGNLPKMEHMQTKLDRKPPKMPSIMKTSVILLPAMANIDFGMHQEEIELERRKQLNRWN